MDRSTTKIEIEAKMGLKTEIVCVVLVQYRELLHLFFLQDYSVCYSNGRL